MSEYNKKLQDLSIKDRELSHVVRKVRYIFIGVIVMLGVGAIIFFVFQSATKENTLGAETEQRNPSVNNETEKPENFASYINNGQPLNSPTKEEVSVVLVDENGNISTSLSSSIAKLYSANGYDASSSILTDDFTQTNHFTELCEGKSSIIDSIQLNKYVDYLVIGKLSFEQHPTEANDLKVYAARIYVSVVSTITKRVENSFEVNKNGQIAGNGFDDSQAKDAAFAKALEIYKTDYSSLK